MDKEERKRWVILIIVLTIGIGATLLNEYLA